jgi:30S ribosomal protein S31
MSLLFFIFVLQKKRTVMGRGDKRTKRGKITIGSFGKARSARTRKTAAKATKKA